ncbi:hypothetical protein C440_04883 [Haloferax mucosum ATCC BAA-1512]|uniref:Uncharacterized protein n=1 Tax=Haloferax mucosum ATCC BAA-1512 TaxID=662479 RepID=M0ILW6_9EURY|nr:hypothetical protein C440_04883 [Haloferax mucosum ATCC BAA-1512]
MIRVLVWVTVVVPPVSLVWAAVILGLQSLLPAPLFLVAGVASTIAVLAGFEVAGGLLSENDDQ